MAVTLTVLVRDGDGLPVHVLVAVRVAVGVAVTEGDTLFVRVLDTDTVAERDACKGMRRRG